MRGASCREMHWLCGELHVGCKGLQLSGGHMQDHHGQRCRNGSGFGDTIMSGSWPC